MDGGFTKAKRWNSKVGSSKEPSSTVQRSKRVRIQEVKNSKINLSSPSGAGASRTKGNVGSPQASEQNLARTFSQMASVLEGFNTKLKSHTSKKSADILSTALRKISSQLQGVESQIQADVGKLTNVGKSSRKQLESTFQEQHKRLRLLHGKFKDEVNLQLQNCRSTLQELEAYQVEIRGTAERQKASHKKLLIEAEEAVKVQVSDAETCIAAVDKEARKRMNCIKQVLDEWMVEVAD